MAITTYPPIPSSSAKWPLVTEFLPTPLFAAVIVSVSTNGLAFTAVAEHAGSAWAGRALGIQNTGQNAFAAATPPVLAAVIGAVGYPAAFGMVVLFPLAAAALVPVGGERLAYARMARAMAPDVPAGR